MKLKAKDQIHVSSVQADSLRPGQEFQASKSVADSLVKRGIAEMVEADENAVSGPVEEKQELPPLNKAEPAAPANKAITGRKPKAK